MPGSHPGPPTLTRQTLASIVRYLKLALLSMPVEQPQAEGQLQERRQALRHRLAPGIPASIHLPSGGSGFVTLGDISRSGACVIRHGSLEVVANDEVFLNVSDYISQNVYLSACVKWVNTWKDKTRVGLAFTEGSLLPGTLLDQYFDSALSAPGSVIF